MKKVFTLAALCCLIFSVQTMAADGPTLAVEVISYGKGGGAGGALTAFWDVGTQTLTITNTGNTPITGATNRLSLNIDSGITVQWMASLTANVPDYNSTILVMGTGTFEMVSGLAANTGTGPAINSYATLVRILGGFVYSTGSNSAIVNNSTGLVEVLGGRVESATETALNNSSTGIVHVSGGTVICTNNSGEAIRNSLTGHVFISEADPVNNPTLISSSNDGMFAHLGYQGTINVRNGKLTVTGGTIENTNNVNGAITINVNGTDSVIISGGLVKANGGYVFRLAVSDSILILKGTAAVFGHGTAFSDLINSSTGVPNPTEGAVAIGWDKSAGVTTYPILSNNDLIKAPIGATVVWNVDTSNVPGIAYTNNINTGFIPIAGITIDKNRIYVNDPMQTTPLSSVSAIQTAIQTALNSGSLVTVTGEFENATDSLALNIPTGDTVLWKAKYSGNNNGFLIYHHTGGGTIQLAENGKIDQTGSGFAVLTYGNVEVKDSAQLIVTTGRAVQSLGNNGTVSVRDKAQVLAFGVNGLAIAVNGNNSAVNVSGGMVYAYNGNAILATGDSSKVNVSGGEVINSGLSSWNPVIYMQNTANTGLNVVVSGKSRVEAEGTVGGAIQTSGSVEIKDSAIVKSATGIAVLAEGTNSTITVSGGTVTTTTGTALYLSGSNGKAIVSGGEVNNTASASANTVISASNTTNAGLNVIISGTGKVKTTADYGNAIGTYGNVEIKDSAQVSATTGIAISTFGDSSRVTVSGGTVSNTATLATMHPVIRMDKAANTGLNVIVSGTGKVQATANDGYAIHTYGNVEIKDNANVSSTTGRAINAEGMNSDVTVSSGTVSSGTGVGIYTSQGGSNVTVSGGTVTTTTGNAIIHSGRRVTVSGTGRVMTIYSGGNAVRTSGSVTVRDAAQILATSGDAIRASGVSSIVDIFGGVVSVYSGRAIYTSGAQGQVSVYDGLVMAIEGEAIHSSGSLSTVSVSGGAVFAHGNALKGSGNVINHASFTAPTGDGIVIAWDRPGPVTYAVGDTTDIVKDPSAAAVVWARTQDDLAGIYYQYNTTSGFIPLSNVTVTGDPIAPLTITTDALSDGVVGSAYSQTLTATGITPIVWSIQSGTLPDNVTLNPTTGELSGTPTAANTFNFVVEAANPTGSTTKALSITVLSNRIFVTDIIDLPTEAVVNVPLTLTGTVVPSNATSQDIEWELNDGYIDTTNALINGNIFTAAKEGVVIVNAFVQEGLDLFIKEFPITVTLTATVAVTDIIDLPTHATVGVPLILSGTVVPDNAAHQDIKWTIKDESSAEAFLSDSTLIPLSEGILSMVASIADGKSIGTPFEREFFIIVNSTGIENVGTYRIRPLVYPNPTTGKFTIYDARLDDLRVEIYDVVGNLLQSKIINQQSKIEIDISHLAAGLYFLKVDGKVLKVVKE